MLDELPGRTVVLRTDLRTGIGREALLLPTSPPARDRSILLGWATEISKQLAAEGFADGDWSFLASEIVPARASAWVHAEPGRDEVTVEALWGFPDGLLHLPHDRFFVDGDEVKRRSVRYKPACLLAEDGQWRYVRLTTPCDWQPTLSPGELRHIAAWGRELASEVDHQVQLMVLARIGGFRGPRAVAPFYYTCLSPPSSEPAPAKGYEFLVSGPADIEGISALSARASAASVRLDPPVEFLRDPVFLRKVGEAAAAAQIPIAFEGSRLGHAFHLLSDAGAVVISPQEKTGNVGQCELVPVVVRRRPGLARVQNLPQSLWERLVVGRIARESLQAWGEQSPSLDVLRELTDCIADPHRAAARSRKALMGGRFDELLHIEERGGLQLPLPPDAPGVVPLFMDEAPRSATDLPAIDRQRDITVSVEAMPPFGAQPRNQVTLPDGSVVRWAGPEITVIIPEV
jgi:hypothetical protein